VEKALHALERLAGLHLSMFGRAAGSAGYALSPFLFHAEFCGLPPAALLDELCSKVAKLVDRGQAPRDSQRRFAGVKQQLLSGSPVVGGFGALPLREHVTARHAVWAVRLLAGPGTAPWVGIARAMLARCWGRGWHLMAPFVGREVYASVPDGSGQWRPVPAPLYRLLAGLLALPPVSDVSQAPLELGPWCASVPLWANPFLTAADGGEAVEGLESVPDAQAFFFSGVRTPGDAWRLAEALEACPPGHAAYQDRILYGVLLRHSTARGHFPYRELMLDLMPSLMAHIPAQWRHAAGVQERVAAPECSSPDNQAAAVALLLQRLGWRMPDGTRVPLAGLTVKRATVLQMADVNAERSQRHQRCAHAAYNAANAADLPANWEAMLSRGLRMVWRLRWHNHRKEVLWRMLLDGLPTGARMHLPPDRRHCPCNNGDGSVWGDRRHHFWHCGVARAVVAEVTNAAGVARLEAYHVWLLQPPGGVHKQVWLVVCLAALRAMWRGQQVLTQGQWQRGAAAAAGSLPLLHAQSAAVSYFWSMLEEFAGLARPPHSWRRLLRPGHPFLHYVSPAAPLRVNRG
jgi:hypothetical protein